MTQFYINPGYKTDERFDWGRLMEYTDNYDVLTSAFIEELRKLPHVGEYVVTSEEGRPDILSHKIYKNTQYWWVLLYYNALTEPAELVTEFVVRFPSRESLEDLYFSMKARDSAAKK